MATRKIVRKRRAPLVSEKVEVAATNYLHHRRVRDEAAESMKEQADIMLSELDRLGVSNYNTPDAKVVVVTPEVKKVNQDKLRKRLGAALWKKVTTLVLDQKKLDAYVAAGDIDPVVVAACIDVSDGTTHVRVSPK